MMSTEGVTDIPGYSSAAFSLPMLDREQRDVDYEMKKETKMAAVEGL